MYDLDKAYSKKFFNQRKSLAWRVPTVVSAIEDVLHPTSVIDVGCGNADLLKGFSPNCKKFGLEGTHNAIDAIGKHDDIYVFIRDLRKPLDDFLLHKADLAICFEVAEHVEPEYADVFVDNLCGLSDRILMTAAPPGQGGRYHVNCRPFAYWFYKFTSRGYRAVPAVSMMLQSQWEPWRHKKGIKAYYNNLMYWERI